MSYNDSPEIRDNELTRFACRFLQDRGAVLEPAASARVDALVPESLTQLLDVPEYFSITADTGESTAPDDTRPDRPTFPIQFGVPLLDRMVRGACSEIPLLACVLKFNYIKASGFDQLIRDEFSFFKSTGKVESTGETRTRYLVLTCRYLAQSDEQKEGLIDLVFNVETGAFVPEMTAAIAAADKHYPKNATSAAFTDQQLAAILERIEQHAGPAVEQEIGPFRDSMNRRFNRDSASLDEYYAALKTEMEKSLERPGLSDQLIQERTEKIALIPEELEIKKTDLFNKYSIKIKIQLSAAMVVTTPIVKVLYNARTGNRRRSLSVTYNPATRAMDPLVCESCGRSMYRIGFSPDLHLVCPDCG